MKSASDTQKAKGSRGFRAVRKTCSDFGKNFTKGTNSIADAILDRTVKTKKERLGKVKTASVEFVKDLASGLKKDLQEVSVLEVTTEASYHAGKASAVVKEVSGKTWSMLMKKLDEDKR